MCDTCHDDLLEELIDKSRLVDDLTNKIIEYQIQEQRLRDRIWELENGRGLP